MILEVLEAGMVRGPGTANLDEDYIPVGDFSRESSLNQREKYLARLMIKTG